MLEGRKRKKERINQVITRRNKRSFNEDKIRKFMRSIFYFIQ